MEATTGGPAHQPLTLLDELLEESLFRVAAARRGRFQVYTVCRIYIYIHIHIYVVYICVYIYICGVYIYIYMSCFF